MNRIIDADKVTFEIIDRPEGGKTLIIFDKALGRPLAPLVMNDHVARTLAEALVAGIGEAN